MRARSDYNLLFQLSKSVAKALIHFIITVEKNAKIMTSDVLLHPRFFGGGVIIVFAPRCMQSNLYPTYTTVWTRSTLR